jgi:hypothetical protein
VSSFPTKTDLDLHSLYIPNNTYVNCYDPDPSLRGLYRKDGSVNLFNGNLSRANGSPKDKAWTDYNHPQRLLELLVCSFVKTSAPLPFMGNQQGWAGPQGMNTQGAHTGINDWRGVRITYDMQIRNFRLGPFSKIGQHVQGNVLRISNALTEYVLNEGLAQFAVNKNRNAYFLPNFIQKRQLISDQLGFGRNSWGKPNDVPVVLDSGRKSVLIEFSINDDDWECFGAPTFGAGDVNKVLQEFRSPIIINDFGEKYARLINYGSSRIEEVLENLQGNSYMIGHHPAPKTGTQWWGKSSAERVSNFDRVEGEIRIFGIKIEKPI